MEKYISLRDKHICQKAVEATCYDDGEPAKTVAVRAKLNQAVVTTATWDRGTQQNGNSIFSLSMQAHGKYTRTIKQAIHHHESIMQGTQCGFTWQWWRRGVTTARKTTKRKLKIVMNGKLRTWMLRNFLSLVICLRSLKSLWSHRSQSPKNHKI